MKATTGRILFGVLIGLVGGFCFGLLAWIVARGMLRSNFNSYYTDRGSGLAALGVLLFGLVTGILVPLVSKSMLRPAVGAGAWMLGTVIYLFLPFVFKNLLYAVARDRILQHHQHSRRSSPRWDRSLGESSLAAIRKAVLLATFLAFYPWRTAPAK